MAKVKKHYTPNDFTGNDPVKYFYFVAHTGGDKRRVTVIELPESEESSRLYYHPVRDIRFDDLTTAIQIARRYAEEHKLHYNLFESDVDSSRNEVVSPEPEPEKKPDDVSTEGLITFNRITTDAHINQILRSSDRALLEGTYLKMGQNRDRLKYYLARWTQAIERANTHDDATHQQPQQEFYP